MIWMKWLLGLVTEYIRNWNKTKTGKYMTSLFKLCGYWELVSLSRTQFPSLIQFIKNVSVDLWYVRNICKQLPQLHNQSISILHVSNKKFHLLPLSELGCLTIHTLHVRLEQIPVASQIHYSFVIFSLIVRKLKQWKTSACRDVLQMLIIILKMNFSNVPFYLLVNGRGTYTIFMWCLTIGPLH